VEEIEIVGTCRFCGQPAGFLKRQHKECRLRHDEAASKITEFFVKALGSSMDPSRFRTMTEEIAHNNLISDKEIRELAITGLQKMITSASTHEAMSEEEDQRISGLCNTFNIQVNELGDSGMRFAKSQILRRLDEGKFPSGVHLTGIPINLERNERPIWLFNNVRYSTIRQRTRYVGASQGMSIRVMKGVYYRAGAFKGEPIRTEHLSEEGRGILVITSHNVYFWSPLKAFKIPLKKILAMQPYSNGIQLTRDGANAKPQLFDLDDPLFACDAIARLSHLD
jgi:hypothetical protein